MKRFFTNGITTIKREVDENDLPIDPIPEGFVRGCGFNKGKTAYNKGWTKETHPELAEQGRKQSERLKGHTPHNKGKTKDTYEPLKRVSEKNTGRSHEAYNKGIPRTEEQKRRQSESMKGKQPYNKGLTKETCESLAKASEKLKGHKCFVSNWEEAKRKERDTKKRNGTSNSSTPQENLLKYYQNVYGVDDVISEYFDSERYPFKCDIYIKSLDKFIEYQGTMEHNGRPFNPSNPDHLEEALQIKNKAEEKGPNSRYWNQLKWWTEIDPLKLKTLRDNKLNFELIYPNSLVITE